MLINAQGMCTLFEDENMYISQLSFQNHFFLFLFVCKYGMNTIKSIGEKDVIAEELDLNYCITNVLFYLFLRR